MYTLRVDLNYQSDWAWNHLGGTLLNVSLRMFPGKVDITFTGGRTHQSMQCPSQIQSLFLEKKKRQDHNINKTQIHINSTCINRSKIFRLRKPEILLEHSWHSHSHKGQNQDLISLQIKQVLTQRKLSMCLRDTEKRMKHKSLCSSDFTLMINSLCKRNYEAQFTFGFSSIVYVPPASK